MDFDFESLNDPLHNTHVGKHFWKMATFFSCYIALVFTCAATLCAVVLIIYITPLSSSAAEHFMKENGWSSGLCFEFTVGGILWMFIALACVSRVRFGGAAYLISIFYPIVVFYILGFIWREASKFSVAYESEGEDGEDSQSDDE